MVTLRASKPSAVRTNTTVSPLMYLQRGFRHDDGCRCFTRRDFGRDEEPGRHLWAALSTEATTRAARVSLSSSGLTNMMVAGDGSPPSRQRW